MKLKLLRLVLFLRTLSLASGAELEFSFQNPPEETKPWCYWYWLNGDITREGITKDLVAMARVGIKRP